MSAYHNRSKESFVLTPINLLRDPGYMQLTNNAKMLWIYLRACYNPNLNQVNMNTGEIELNLTYSYMAKIKGFQSRAMSNSINELIDGDYIKKSKQGNIFNGMSAYTFIGKYADFPNGNKKHKKPKRK